MLNEINDPWAEYEISEEVSEAEKKESESLSIESPVGLFLCTISRSLPADFTSKKYSCPMAKIQFTIDEVIEIEQPAIDKNGKIIEVDGKPKMVVAQVNEDKVFETNALHAGRLIFDDIRLFGVGETEFMKKRRINFLLNSGINLSNGITTKTFAKDILSRQIVVKTVHNSYENKSGETVNSVKVDFFNGYAHANTVNSTDDDVNEI